MQSSTIFSVALNQQEQRRRSNRESAELSRRRKCDQIDALTALVCEYYLELQDLYDEQNRLLESFQVFPQPPIPTGEHHFITVEEEQPQMISYNWTDLDSLSAGVELNSVLQDIDELLSEDLFDSWLDRELAV